MQSFLRSTLTTVALSCVLLSGASAQRKAAPVNASSAPVPSPILAGKRAFISFELGDVRAFPSIYSGGPERAYDEFYKGMLAWGHYQLVADPKDADVIFAIRFVDPPGIEPQFRLAIMDARGRVALWGFTEELDSAFRKKHRDAAFSKAINQLVMDVQTLVNHGPQASAQP